MPESVEIRNIDFCVPNFNIDSTIFAIAESNGEMVPSQFNSICPMSISGAGFPAIRAFELPGMDRQGMAGLPIKTTGFRVLYPHRLQFPPGIFPAIAQCGPIHTGLMSK